MCPSVYILDIQSKYVMIVLFCRISFLHFNNEIKLPIHLLLYLIHCRSLKIILSNHGIEEWLVLEGSLKIISSNSPAMGKDISH